MGRKQQPTAFGQRHGIATAGHWIIDRVKTIDVWPSQGHLANILSEERGNGGCAYNVIKDLRRLDPKIPLEALGCLGDDADADWILNDLRANNIDATGMVRLKGVSSSHTDVMAEQGGGRRTFFYHGGANDHLDAKHFELGDVKSRILHLGYLALFPKLDTPDADCETGAARVLAEARKLGIRTSADTVSLDQGRYEQIIRPALRHLDYFIVNEHEACGIYGLEPRTANGKPNEENLREALRRIAQDGVSKIAAIHFPEGAMVCDVPSGQIRRYDALAIPAGEIRGTVGAGDAFCAGMLYGAHEEWPLDESVQLALATAASCLRHPTASEGIGTIGEVKGFWKKN